MRTNVRQANKSYADSQADANSSTAAVSPVIALIRRLRNAGLPISPSDAIIAVQALNHVEIENRDHVKAALRTTLVKNPVHNQIFNRNFDAVFPRIEITQEDVTNEKATSDEPGSLEDDLASAMRAGDESEFEKLTSDAVEKLAAKEDGRSAGHHTQRILRQMNLPNLYQKYLENDEERSEFDRTLDAAEATAALEQLKRRIGDLVNERLNGDEEKVETDIGDIELLKADADQLAALRAVLRPLAKKLAAKLGAKRRRGRGGLDMRRTIRASMGFGGVPVVPHFRRRRPTRPDLVVLCDVSGSTAEFANFTLALLHAVHQEFNRVRTFVFVDGIVEVTDILQANPGLLEPRLLLDRQGLIAKDGRSDYTEAFRRFIKQWPDALTPRTTMIVVGDARQHDRAPAIQQITEMQKQVRKLFWFNPEPSKDWDQNDSRISMYANHCTAVFEVSTLQQLISAVEAVA